MGGHANGGDLAVNDAIGHVNNGEEVVVGGKRGFFALDAEVEEANII